MRNFDLLIGIDYSGAQTPDRGLKGLQVYAARPGELPTKQFSPARRRNGEAAHWSRAAIAGWLLGLHRAGVRFLAGIDHGFSFPAGYFERYGLAGWPAFLDDFVAHWPAHRDGVTVESLRARNPRTGSDRELRLCETWAPGAKSVFQFDVQGQVAKSTHAGLPWVHRLRAELGDGLHVWPFDGWLPGGERAVVAEVFPSLLRQRYPREGRTVDEQDAYAVARWLADLSGRDLLARYLEPPLSPAERAQAALEGWILGIA